MITSRLIATSFALIAFTGALFVGMQAGNPILTILIRALGIMLGCYVVGRVIGAVADRTLAGQIAAYQQRHPLQDAAQQTSDGGEHGERQRPEKLAA